MGHSGGEMMDTPGIYETTREMEDSLALLPPCDSRESGIQCDGWGARVQNQQGHCLHFALGVKCCHCGERIEDHD